MQLRFDDFDGRRSGWIPVIDADTGQQVGRISPNGTGRDAGGGIDISLFGGKYQTQVNSKPECQGFILGVQAVLNHVTRLE